MFSVALKKRVFTSLALVALLVVLPMWSCYQRQRQVQHNTSQYGTIFGTFYRGENATLVDGTGHQYSVHGNSQNHFSLRLPAGIYRSIGCRPDAVSVPDHDAQQFVQFSC